MHKSILKAVSKIMAAAISLSAICGSSMPTHAAGDLFQVEKAGSGYAITGISEKAIVDGTVTVPDAIDGIDVTQLGVTSQVYTFLGRNAVTKLEIGQHVKGATSYAFYGAKDLAEISIAPENKALHYDTDDGILYGKSGGNGILIKYLSPTERKDYTIPAEMVRIFNMDYAKFFTLDLNNVTRIEKLTFAGTEIDTLKVGDAAMNGSHDILYGASVGAFDAGGSSVYESDGQSLWKGDRLIKVALDAEFEEGYFDQFNSISPYAFNSIAEYMSIQELIPEQLTKNVVFSFFSQNDGVFIVNGEISFCYDYNKKVPTSIGSSEEYSENIDAEKYGKIKALMYVGVPFNGTGIFEEVFGEDYESIASDPVIMQHGNAALNVVSAIVYKTIDGHEPAEIKGIGYGPFTKENVSEYKIKIQEAVDSYESYNFKPGFLIENSTVRFHKENGKYISDPLQVDTLDGNGEVNNSYFYTIHITTPGISIQGGGDSFKTGTKIVLESEERPTEFSVAYDEPSLKYYKRISEDVQNVLASATKRTALDLKVNIAVGDISISKQDITTNRELPGAALTLIKDGGLYGSWISGTEPHIIKNPENGAYTLIETTAPDGYEIAEEITFTVKDGTVEGGLIVMYDKPLPEDGTPSEPDVGTPSEPDKGTPSEPDTPTKPDRPSSGGSNGGGGSSGGSGSNVPRRENPLISPFELNPLIEVKPTDSLPKTNDAAPAALLSMASLATLFLVFRWKKSIILIRNK